MDPVTISSAAGALGSALGGIFGKKKTSEPSAAQLLANQKDLAKYTADLNYNHSIQYQKESPLAQRQGLEEAGYNPMLAMSGYNAGSASTFAGTGSAGSYDYNSGESNKIAKATNALSLGRLANEVKAVHSQAKNLDEDTKTRSIQNWWAPLMKSLQYDQATADIDNTKANTDLQVAQTAGQLATNKHLPALMRAQVQELFTRSIYNLQAGSATTSNARQMELNSEQERKWYGFNHIAGPVLGVGGMALGAYATKGKSLISYPTGYTDNYYNSSGYRSGRRERKYTYD